MKFCCGLNFLTPTFAARGRSDFLAETVGRAAGTVLPGFFSLIQVFDSEVLGLSVSVCEKIKLETYVIQLLSIKTASTEFHFESVERWTECSITCAYVHIGAQLKVKWRIEIFLCAFLKLDENPLKMLIFQLILKL